MDVILDIFKDKLVCFCVSYLKTFFFFKCIFMVSQFFSCILFFRPNSGLPWTSPKLNWLQICCHKGRKTKEPEMTLCVWPAVTEAFIWAVWEQPSTNPFFSSMVSIQCEDFLFFLQGQAFLCNQVICTKSGTSPICPCCHHPRFLLWKIVLLLP